jgi:hypothetical protein
MTEDKRDGLSMTEICEPVPGKHTFGTYDDVFPIRADGIEEGIGIGRHITVEDDLAMPIKDTDIHGSGVGIDTAIEEVFFGIESRRGGLNEYPAASAA